MESALQCCRIEAGYRHHAVLHDLSLTVGVGELLALLGPNGAGKSTLLQAATGLLRLTAGEVRLFGRPLAEITPRARARLVGVVAQELSSPMSFSVEELITLGRTARHEPWQSSSARDRAVVAEVLELTNTGPLRQRIFQTLSSGEQQRVALALALAAEPRLLLLDEAVSHLDPGQRLEIIELIRRINRERNIAVLMIVHDLNLAAEFFPRVVMLAEGRVVADGTPATVFKPDFLARVYGCRMTVVPDDSAGCLRLFPLVRVKNES